MRAVELTEAFTSPYEFHWINNPPMAGQQMAGKFKGKTETYIFKFDPRWREGVYEIDFQTSPVRSGGFKLTGTGDAYRVLATVMAMIEDGIKVLREHGKPVTEIIFTAEKAEEELGSTGRATLYKRMVEKYAGRIGTATIDESDSMLVVRIKVKQP